MKVKLKRGRPQLSKRNFAICHLKIKQNMTLAELADLFGTDKTNISHILERHLKEYFAIDKINPSFIMQLLNKGRASSTQRTKK